MSWEKHARPVSQEEYVRMRVSSMREEDLQSSVIEMAKHRGWKFYHPYDSRRSVAGWPDLVLVRGDRTLFRELKREKGYPTPDQREWLAALEQAGNDVGVWKPRHWFDRTIEKELA